MAHCEAVLGWNGCGICGGSADTPSDATSCLNRPVQKQIKALSDVLVASVLCCAGVQELEEARRLYTSQKRALKDALSAAAERDAAEVAAGESGLEAATAAAEEEVERLTQVCGGWRETVPCSLAWNR